MNRSTVSREKAKGFKRELKSPSIVKPNSFRSNNYMLVQKKDVKQSLKQINHIIEYAWHKKRLIITDIAKEVNTTPAQLMQFEIDHILNKDTSRIPVRLFNRLFLFYYKIIGGIEHVNH